MLYTPCKPGLDALVVNWHVLEGCNFRCGYCYAKWRHDQRETWRNPAATTNLLRELGVYFAPGGEAAASLGIHWDRLRLTIAGGEPGLLGPRLAAVVSEARSAGFAVSVITNGSRPGVLLPLAPQLEAVGISIDSARGDANRATGRAGRDGTTVTVDAARELVDGLQAHNPDLVLKVNTVVNAANWDENLGPVLQVLRPGRWKIMRVLPVYPTTLAVSDAQFAGFVFKHAAFAGVMTVEDNTDMQHSYVMVDPLGRFFQNAGSGNGYVYSEPILEVGATGAFRQVPFDIRKFASRYASLPTA